MNFFISFSNIIRFRLEYIFVFQLMYGTEQRAGENIPTGRKLMTPGLD